MHDYFSKEKSDFLKKKDKSKKGCIDKDAVKIVKEINFKEGYYTTSSCSGRIVLLEKLSNKKNQSRWIFTKHDKVTSAEIFGLLKNQKFRFPIWFKQEPIILHVRCRDINSAKKLLKASRTIFRRAGIISLNEKKIIIEIIGSERIDTIAADKNFISDKIFVENLVKYANKNFDENKRKMGKLLSIIRKL